jgi:hypothetical protein
MSDPGVDEIHDLFEALQIDEQWCVREPRGFTWWAHRLAQRIWADEAADDDGYPVWIVRAQTDLLSDVTDDGSIAGKVGALNALASMSALVWHPEQRTITLNCAAYLHEGDAPWLQRSLMMAVALQVAEAHHHADAYAELLGATVNESQHPQSGARVEPDDMLNVIADSPARDDASPYTTRDFEVAANMFVEMGLLASHGKASLAVEVPFTGDEPAAARISRGVTGPPQTALIQAYGDVEHPQLGSGLFVVMRLPITLEPPRAARVAADLNLQEALTAFTHAHFFGAWCARPDEDISYVAFVPSAAWDPSLLLNFVLGVGVHARWASTLAPTRAQQ